jgi:hypothetical protein
LDRPLLPFVGGWLGEKMKLTKLLGYMAAAAVGYAVPSNMSDFKRYIRV